MPNPRHVKAGVFWRLTCGIDTNIKNAAKFNTPWNHFTEDDILVCSVWRTDIVPIHDPDTGVVRRFVQMGNVDAGWSSTLKKKGREAAARLADARTRKRRVVGFELEPRLNRKDPDEQLIDFFYLERPYELTRVWETHGDFERLQIAEKFKARGWGPSTVAGSTPGYYFELLAVERPVPGWSRASPQLRALLEPGYVVAPAAPPAVETVMEGSSAPAETDPAQAQADLSPPPPAPAPAAPPADGGQGGWGGGESESHQALKAYVAANPALFGLPADAVGIPEFELWSGDRIDVVFQTAKSWHAVEVKSQVSNLDDYRRGIYQVVKYRAVLEAMAAWEAPTRARKVRVVLALQNSLPASLRHEAAHCHCEVKEKVQPTDAFLAARAAAALAKLASAAPLTLTGSAPEDAAVSCDPVAHGPVRTIAGPLAGG